MSKSKVYFTSFRTQLGHGLPEKLQKLIRTMPGVASVRDEHIQFGGTGVTIVTFD